VKDVGATLVIALLPTDVARKPGDHKGRPKGRPYSRQCWRTRLGPRRISEAILPGRRKNESLPSRYT